MATIDLQKQGSSPGSVHSNSEELDTQLTNHDDRLDLLEGGAAPGKQIVFSFAGDGAGARAIAIPGAGVSVPIRLEIALPGTGILYTTTELAATATEWIRGETGAGVDNNVANPLTAAPGSLSIDGAAAVTWNAGATTYYVTAWF